MPVDVRINDLEERIADLEAALRHAHDLADAERRRAQRAVESAERAWRLATWTRPSGLNAK